MTKSLTNAAINDVEQLIKAGVAELIAATKNQTPKKYKKRKRKPKTTKSFDMFDIPIKSDDIESNLIPFDPSDKYARFNGGNKDPLSVPLEKDYRKRPPSADAMGSALASGGGVAPAPAVGIGWGVSGWGVSGFGESINSHKSRFIDYVNSLYAVSDVESTDILLSHVIKGYKTVFDDLESKTTVVTMGMQPSFAKFFNDKIEEYVLAINTFIGEIVCVYIGESNGMETIDDMRDWYIHIGVDSDIVDRIVFIEKSTVKNDASMIDLEFKGKSGQLDNTTDIFNLVNLFNNAILVGCFDLYFAFDLMLALSKAEKRFEVDKRFSFVLD
jgi:hypothetical protein